MASCNTNSSNLLGNININSITSSGARLLMTHPLSGFSGGRISGTVGDDGITAGDAIRYNAIAYHATNNPSGGKYIKAKADKPENSEVVGIVESVSEVNPSDPSSGIATVVMLGQIEYPTTKLLNATHIDDVQGLSGAAGGNDVYFLSATNAGQLQNLAPAEPTQIVKPVYQVAPDGNWTGQVVNYIGYQAGGQVVGERTDEFPVGTTIEVPKFGPSSIEDNRPGWKKLDGQELNLNGSKGLETYGYAFKILKSFCSITTEITVSTTPSTTLNGKTCFVRIDGRKEISGSRILDSSVPNKTLKVRWDTPNSDKLDKYLIAGNYLEVLGSGNRYKIVSVKNESFTLPRVTNPSPLRLKVDNNKARTVPRELWMYIAQDQTPGDDTSIQNFVISMPENLTIKEATIEKLTLDDSTATITVLDALKNLQSASEVYATKLEGTGNTTSINTAQINK